MPQGHFLVECGDFFVCQATFDSQCTQKKLMLRYGEIAKSCYNWKSCSIFQVQLKWYQYSILLKSKCS